MRTFFILFVTLSIFSCTAQDKRSYLALGDSYTIGESVDEQYRWPNQLVKYLKEDSIEIHKPQIIARTGWRTDQIYYAAGVIRGEKYDLVSVLAGVNDQYQGKSIEHFEPEFRRLLNFAIDHCKKGIKGVFVVSIPDYGCTPYGKSNEARIAKELDEYNAICKEICKEKGVVFYDITPISKKAKTNPELVAKDGLHPSEKMYKLWVKRIYIGVKNQLTDN